MRYKNSWEMFQAFGYSYADLARHFEITEDMIRNYVENGWTTSEEINDKINRLKCDLLIRRYC